MNKTIIAGSVLVMLLFGARTHGADLEVSVAYCPDIWIKDFQSEGLNHDALELEISHQVKGPLYGALSLRRLHATLTYPQVIDGQYFQGNHSTLDVSLRLGWKTEITGLLHGSVFGGFGYMLNHQQPEFGDSGMLAHIGVMLSLENERWKIGYGLAHYSDPTQSGDFGRNYQLIIVGLKW